MTLNDGLCLHLPLNLLWEIDEEFVVPDISFLGTSNTPIEEMSLQDKLTLLSSNYKVGKCSCDSAPQHVSDPTFGNCISFNKGNKPFKIENLSLHPLLSKFTVPKLNAQNSDFLSEFLRSAKEDFKGLFPRYGNSIDQINGITISFWAKYTHSKEGGEPNVILFAEHNDGTDIVGNKEILHIAFESNVTNDGTSDNITGQTIISFKNGQDGKPPSIDYDARHPNTPRYWVNWAFTVDFTQGVMKIYREGIVFHNYQVPSNQHQILQSASSKINQEFDIFLGSENYQGRLAHLRVYNRVLSPEEINECMKVDKKTENGEDNPLLDVTPDTTLKPMEYQIYQVKGNPTIKTGYPASKWTAVIAGYNCGAEQQHKATALKIMPVVDDGEWKIKCDIKGADDSYWDVGVLFIRNNVVNRLNNFRVE